jgi:hypothetical protein
MRPLKRYDSLGAGAGVAGIFTEKFGRMAELGAGDGSALKFGRDEIAPVVHTSVRTP